MSRLTPLVAVAAGALSALLVVRDSHCAVAGTGPLLLAQAQPPQPPQNIETSISQLHQRLQITPAQEPKFNAVANVMRENARAEAKAPHEPPPTATAVEDLRALVGYTEVELAGLKKMLSALEGLYATLSPAQKKTADAVFRPGPGE
ncbi:MAG: Spy/CpxP family protein refolding chaperone [Alphaproteobacteria bacterium]|nr:Spy/CpxP family protein refolding chaperone [Alphaproteobacteria bacterium]